MWEIAEHTIKSGYVIEVQNGHLNFIRGLQFLCWRENFGSALCSIVLQTKSDG